MQCWNKTWMRHTVPVKVCCCMSRAVVSVTAITVLNKIAADMMEEEYVDIHIIQTDVYGMIYDKKLSFNFIIAIGRNKLSHKHLTRQGFREWTSFEDIFV